MNQIENTFQIGITPSQFCRSVTCIFEGHGELPVELICFSQECNATSRLMCINCISIHNKHNCLPINKLDDLTTKEFQADE